MSDTKRKVLALSRKAETVAAKQEIPATCSTCRFNYADETKNECRKLSPTSRGFPKVVPEMWCGQYKVTFKVLDQTPIDAACNSAAPIT